jgi:hypothetical protein
MNRIFEADMAAGSKFCRYSKDGLEDSMAQVFVEKGVYTDLHCNRSEDKIVTNELEKRKRGNEEVEITSMKSSRRKGTPGQRGVSHSLLSTEQTVQQW